MPQASLDKASGTLFGVALNYRGLLDSRLAEFQQPPYQKQPVKPVLFIKTPNTRNGEGRPVTIPCDERLTAGPALGVVIGRAASRVGVEQALEHVAGYTVINEFSLPEDSYYRPAVKAKCRDGFCGIGAQLASPEEVPDPQRLPIRLYVNGELRQENTTANMVRGVAELISELSEFMTLGPGDVLITGVPEGRVELHAGDRVRVEIPGVGSLTNTVVAE
ncbi:fumarylacetoacetate hydrolase family protein [Azotobacter chroococcum]|uniref:Fumarylacetoacetate hydrolase family protein n=1 Tax=Azotobacter chroococcum TaxID=353 RepID=A0AAQ0C1A2_9GAMM|nr:fumarylacetoacetate hydrolase family protein [Azotobacter chroococcum]QQE91348.1 fumarylacetoacetate hydrolase family protein [Azotobacter chroococcum]